MTDLAPYVAAWRAAADSILELTPTNWDVETDLPGWTAKDILAHLVHLERVLVEGEASNTSGKVVPADYTNAGVDALKNQSAAELKADLTDLIERRTAQLAELPDPAALATNTPAGVKWTWETALRNRAIDVWMHEQDLRRAFELPGGLATPGAFVTALTFAAGLGYALVKQAGATGGTVVRWQITGPVEIDSTLTVGADGRARPSNDIADATLTMDTEAFIILGGGRRGRAEVEVVITGDQELGERVLAAMTLTS